MLSFRVCSIAHPYLVSGAFIRGENLYPLALCTGDRNLKLDGNTLYSLNR